MLHLAICTESPAHLPSQAFLGHRLICCDCRREQFYPFSCSMLSVPFLEISHFIQLWLEQPLEPIVKFLKYQKPCVKDVEQQPCSWIRSTKASGMLQDMHGGLPLPTGQVACKERKGLGSFFSDLCLKTTTTTNKERVFLLRLWVRDEFLEDGEALADC